MQEEKYLQGLNDKQREAVLYDGGPLLILAGAGSGKTAVMVRRIARLLAEGEDPRSIIAVTFTNKAASEMRERADRLTEAGAAKDVWIRTFHSACLQILRYGCERIGYTKSFTVYDKDDSEKLMKRIMKENRPEDGDYAFKPADMMSAINKSKELQVSVSRVADMYLPVRDVASAVRLANLYEERMRKSNCMDFTDLLVNGVKLLEENEDILTMYQSRFRHILVDEFQDTNAPQYRFVRLLADGASPDICVVGDDDQCIYEWRGANIGNILGFERDFRGAKIVKLEQNYRSTQNIVGGAASVIRRNLNRKDKTLWTENPAGAKISVVGVRDGMDEPKFAADIIQSMVRTGQAKYSDFAILYRGKHQSRTFEEVFLKRNIPYEIVKGTEFYGRSEVRDVLAYMRVIANSDDDVSFLRIVNTPRRGIGPKAVEALTAESKKEGLSLMDAISDIRICAELGKKPSGEAWKLGKMLEKLANSAAAKVPLSTLFEDILEETQYLAMLKDQKDEKAEDRIENVQELGSIIAEFEKSGEEQTLAAFLEHVSLLQREEEGNEGSDKCSLMTLHSAKGLEFPYVFIVGAEEGTFPNMRGAETLEQIEAKTEEERRLCYVGISRAMKKLWIMHARERYVNGKYLQQRPSRFLYEIDESVTKQEFAAYEMFGNRRII